jgi:hypothetical protein
MEQKKLFEWQNRHRQDFERMVHFIFTQYSKKPVVEINYEVGENVDTRKI